MELLLHLKHVEYPSSKKTYQFCVDLESLCVNYLTTIIYSSENSSTAMREDSHQFKYGVLRELSWWRMVLIILPTWAGKLRWIPLQEGRALSAFTSKSSGLHDTCARLDIRDDEKSNEYAEFAERRGSKQENSNRIS